MRFMSLPADFRTDTIDRYAELNDRVAGATVAETYGQATTGVPTGSGREYSLIPSAGLAALQRYVAYSESRGVAFNYTLNASCLGNREFTGRGLRELQRFLDRLWDAGVRNLTVTLPQLLTIVKLSGHPFSVRASTICQVGSAFKAQHYRDEGADRVVIDEDITRDFRRIRQITAAFGDGVEMIVNSACTRDCPYKMFHYNQMSHFSFGSQAIKSYYSRCCNLQKTADPERVMRLNWVRPEDLHYYEEAGVHWFKIQGRQSVHHGDPVRTAEAYMTGHHEGNLYDLLRLFETTGENSLDPYPYVDNAGLEGFLAPFAEDPGFCTGDCDDCGHCRSFAAKAMDLEATGRVFRAAHERLLPREPFSGYREQSVRRRATRAAARRAYDLVRGMRG